MPYDPAQPASIFTQDAIAQFMDGLTNAYRLRHGIPGGDLNRDDVGRSMVALGDAEAALDPNAELKTRPVVSTDCRYNDHEACDGEESAIWPDGDQTMRKCSCVCHQAKPQPLKTTYCWSCNAEDRGLRYYSDSWLCEFCIGNLGGKGIA